MSEWTTGSERAPEKFRILTVCTGNICRSPTMERLLLARLRERVGTDQRVDVSSAGTWGLVGEPMTVEAARCLSELGGDPAGFAARELTPELIQAADLILAATREHRAAVVTMEPRAAGRSLTWRELARLLSPVTADQVSGTDEVQRMRSIVTLAMANRGLVPLEDPRDDDIADPYGASLASYLRAAAEIDEALNRWLDLLAPAPVARS